MGWYVYHLIDPRSNAVFYVGKGKGDRADHHLREARQGSGHPKCDVIRSIWSDGLEVSKYVVRRFHCEQEAYSFEAAEIARIGIQNLTNIAPGGGAPRRRVARSAEELTRDVAAALLNNVAHVLRIKAKNLKFTEPWQSFVDESMPRVVKSVFDRFGAQYVAAELAKYGVKAEFEYQNGAPVQVQT